MTKKIFAMFLAVLMVVSMLPTTVFAAKTDCPYEGTGKHTKENCEYTELRVVAPGCGTVGYTVNQCNECGDEFRTDEVKATGEHVLVDLEAKAPTCGEYGWETGKMCAVCKKVFPVSYIAPVVKEGYSCEWTDWAPENVDCTTGGVKTRECKHCGAVEELEITLEETGGKHTWDKENPKVVTPATPDANGLATVECLTCKVTKEVVVFYEHSHIYLYDNGKAPSCDNEGHYPYRTCRICGQLWMKMDDDGNYDPAGDWEKVEAEDLVRPAEHDFGGYEPTCVDTMLKCVKCEEYVAVSVEHEVDWKETDWQVGDARHYYDEKAADCVSSGYVADWCNVCKEFRDVKILPVQGHHTVTVSVPATCGSFAYTYTYCTRPGCVVAKKVDLTKDETYDTTLYPYLNLKVTPYEKVETLPAFTVAEQTAIGPFYLAMEQTNVGTALYFTGEMDGDFLATSNDVNAAVGVYLERIHVDAKAEGEFRLFFLNEDSEKVYISVEGYIAYFKGSTAICAGDVKLSTTVPTTYWKWDDTADMLFTTVVCGEDKYGEEVEDTFFLGTYGEYETIAASADFYYNNSYYPQIYVHLSNALANKEMAQVLSFKHDIKAGYNSNKHVYDVLNPEYVLAPTCTEAGEAAYNCIYCNAAYMFDVPATHKWEKTTTKVTINGKEDQPAYLAPTCEDGYQHYSCAKCDAEMIKVLPGYGHLVRGFHKADPDHVTPVDYTYLYCVAEHNGEKCDYKKILEKKTWDNYGKLYETMEDALKDHTLDTNTEKHTVKGDCYTVGEYRYTCLGCGKSVRVKEAGTGEHLPAANPNKVINCTLNTRFVCDYTGWYELVINTSLSDDDMKALYEGLRLAELKTGVIIKTGEIDNVMKFYLEEGKTYNFRHDSIAADYTLKTIDLVKEPTCTAGGWIVTYVCTRVTNGEKCEKTVGKEAGSIEYLDKLDHNWEAIKSYEPEDCEYPDFYNATHKCKDCGAKKYDTTLIHAEYMPASQCEGTVFQYYLCHCGEEHIRGYNVWKHNYVRLPDVTAEYAEAYYKLTGITLPVTYQAPTCYEEGFFTMACDYCGDKVPVEYTTIPTVQHTNAAGEKFDVTCLTASVEDRHCVICHEVQNHQAKGNSHKCGAPIKDKDGKVVGFTCEGECWFSAGHKYETTLHPSTCIEDGYSKTTCAYCGDEVVKFVNGGWNGHKPAAAQKDEDGNWIKYGNYEYEMFTYYSVIVDGDELVTVSETYYAEFALGENGETGYIPATHSSEGFARSYCQICKDVHEWILPRLENLEFEVSADADEYTYGSLIEVTVTVDGYEELIHGFNFELDYGFDAHVKADCTTADCADVTHYAHVSHLLFVGAETLNSDFMFSVSTPKAAMAGNKIQIVGQASNDANGKVRNLEINEKTELVKLYFRVLSDVKDEVSFTLNNKGVRVYDATGKTAEEKYPAVNVQLINESADLRVLGDFNNDKFVADIDLYQAMTLLTGEQEDGKTYDVTVDFDKDGVITVEDLLIGYDLFVGNIKSTFFVGIGEAETALIVDLLGLNEHAYNCINHCGYGSDYAFIICPNCYTAQNQGK